MARQVRVPYDIAAAIVDQVDDGDLGTLCSLALVSQSVSYAAQKKLWTDLRLTTDRSVERAFRQVLRQPRLRDWVRSIRMPTATQTDEWQATPGWYPTFATGLSDPRVLGVLAACHLAGPSQQPRDSVVHFEFSLTECMIAAMMALCPKLRTAVIDACPSRRFNTLAFILLNMVRQNTVQVPRIDRWRILPDTFLGRSGGMHEPEWLHVNDPILRLVQATKCEKLDLLSYADGIRCNRSTVPVLERPLPDAPYLKSISELCVEDNVFKFDSPVQQRTSPTPYPGTFRVWLIPFIAGEWQDFRLFMKDGWSLLNKLGRHVRRLRWKIAMPHLDGFGLADLTANGELPGDGGVDDVFEEEEDFLENPPFEEPDTESDSEEEEVGPAVISPSLMFCRTWKHLTHLETTTGSLYGFPYALFESLYVTQVHPPSIEDIVLVERWNRWCGPHENFTALYRRSLHRDLCCMARRQGFPKLRRLVFIPDKRCSYWPGLPERLVWEWTAGVESGAEVQFPEMREIVEDASEVREADRQRLEWQGAWEPLRAKHYSMNN